MNTERPMIPANVFQLAQNAIGSGAGQSFFIIQVKADGTMLRSTPQKFPLPEGKVTEEDE